MPCKQSELITAINSFAAARTSSDQVLTNFSANLVAKLLDTLEFDAEDQPEYSECLLPKNQQEVYLGIGT